MSLSIQAWKQQDALRQFENKMSEQQTTEEELLRKKIEGATVKDTWRMHWQQRSFVVDKRYE